MEDWVGLAARGGREIRWYDLHGESNPGRSHGSTMVYPLCCSRLNWIISVPKWEFKWCSFHLRYKTFFFISCALNSIHHAGLLFIFTTQTNFSRRKLGSVFLNILNWQIMLHNSSPDFDINRLSWFQCIIVRAAMGWWEFHVYRRIHLHHFPYHSKAFYCLTFLFIINFAVKSLFGLRFW